MEKDVYVLEESFGYHINSLAVAIKRNMDEYLKPYSLTHLQFSILMSLYKNNVTTQKEILRFTYGDEAGITRHIDKLELKGYLQRSPCSTDKRKKKLVLTNDGITLIEEIITYACKVNRELTKTLDKEEADTFLKLLQKVNSSLYEI